MRNTTALPLRQFGGADVEMAVDLQGVTIDDFAMEILSNLKGQFALSGPGWSSDCNQWHIGRVCVYGAWGICGQTPLYNKKKFFDPMRGCREAEKRVDS